MVISWISTILPEKNTSPQLVGKKNRWWSLQDVQLPGWYLLWSKYYRYIWSANMWCMRMCIYNACVYIYIYTISYIITTYVCGYPCTNMLFLSHLDECSLSTTSILPWLPPNHFPATPRPWISQHHPMHVPKGRAIQCQVSILQRWHRGTPQKSGRSINNQNNQNQHGGFTCKSPKNWVFTPLLNYSLSLLGGHLESDDTFLVTPNSLGSAFKNNAPRNFHLHNSLLNLEQTSPT